jgi:hypothetical protein
MRLHLLILLPSLLLSLPSAADRLMVATDATGEMDEAAAAALLLVGRAELGEIGFADNQSSLRAIKDTGARCMPQDSACWQRIHSLVGVDETWVWVPLPGSLGRLSRFTSSGETQTPLLSTGPAGLRAAIQRIAGTTAAIVITGAPLGATITIDGTVRDAVVESILPGWHKMRIQTGDDIRNEDVLLQAGQVLPLKVTAKSNYVADGGLDEEVVVPVSSAPFPWLGATVVSLGAVATIGGVIVLVPAVLEASRNPSYNLATIQTGIGIGLVVVGAAGIGVGVGAIVIGME